MTANVLLFAYGVEKSMNSPDLEQMKNPEMIKIGYHDRDNLLFPWSHGNPQLVPAFFGFLLSSPCA